MRHVHAPNRFGAPRRVRGKYRRRIYRVPHRSDSIPHHIINIATMNLPGFPNCERASAHTLKYKYDWSDEQLSWLDKHWVRIGEENGMGVYRRPPSGMDKSNQNAYKVLVEQGTEKAIEHVMKDPKTGEAISYANMRLLYG